MEYIRREDKIAVLNPEPAECRKLKKLGIQTVQELLDAPAEALEKLKDIRTRRKLLRMGRGNFILENWDSEIPCRRGNLRWELKSGGELVISGAGKMSDFSDVLLPPWKDCLDQIRMLRLCEGVENVGGRAFSGAVNLAHVILPESVAYLGFRAFEGCAALKRVDSPRTLVSWRDPGAGKVLPVGKDAFAGALWTPQFPKGLLIREGVLLEWYGDGDSLEIPEGVREIGPMALEGKSLERVVLPQSLRRIHACAFRGNALRELSIPKGVEEIGPWAFSGNPDLNRVVLPAGRGLTVDSTAFTQTPVAGDWRPVGKWRPLQELEQVEEPEIPGYRRLIFRNRTPAMGVRRSNLRTELTRLLKNEHMVLRICVDADKKTVEYVQGFVKHPKLDYLTVLMYPCTGQKDGSVDIWSDSITYLDEDDISTLDMTGLRQRKQDGKYQWYCAPFRPLGQYDMPYELLRDWKRQHPEYRLYSQDENRELQKYRILVPN